MSLAEAVTLGQFDETVMGRYVVGRRKAAVVRARFTKGSGKIFVNGRSFEEYSCLARHRESARHPLVLAAEQDARFASVDVHCLAVGGGITGQAEALRLAVARKVVELSQVMRGIMRQRGYLTCDSRRVESKKYGQHKARRRCQYAKR